MFTVRTEWFSDFGTYEDKDSKPMDAALISPYIVAETLRLSMFDTEPTQFIVMPV
jgi:hypothetical protein